MKMLQMKKMPTLMHLLHGSDKMDVNSYIEVDNLNKIMENENIEIELPNCENDKKDLVLGEYEENV